MLLLWGLLAGCSATAEARSPPKKRPEDHVAGEQIWERSCWQCHGEDNDGQGPAASALPGGVPDLRNTVNPSRYGELVDVILDGRGDMPAFRAEMDKHQARRALIYMERIDQLAEDRSNAKPPADESSKDDAAVDETKEEENPSAN